MSLRSLPIVAAAGLAGCPAQVPEPPYQPPVYAPPAPSPVTVYPEVSAELMIANHADIPQLFRIRTPRPEVQIDCAGVADDPGGRLVAELFGPAQAWVLDPGRAMSARPNTFGGECAVLLVDGPGLEPRLVFYAPSEFTAAYFSTEARAVQPARALVVTGTAEGAQWGEHPALWRLEVPEEVGPECATPAPGTGVDWSTPPSGLVALLGMSVGADGCHALDLEVGEAPYRWFVCAPGVELPFAVGDDLRVGPVWNGIQGLAVDGVRIEGPAGALTLMRGADLPVAHTVAPVEGCDGHIDACGAFVQAARVQVGGRFVAPGEAAALDGGTLHVYRAEQGAAVNLACLPFARVGLPVVEAAWVERFAPPAEAPAETNPEAEAPDPEGDAGGAI